MTFANLPILVRETDVVSHDPTRHFLPGGTETILLAEDDASVRALNFLVLQAAGYTVIAAVDGTDALEKYEQNEAAIAMVVSDVMMPHLDGYGLYRELLKRNPVIKFLLTSGYTGDLVGMNGDYDFLEKPIRPHDLLVKVRSILDE